MAASTLPRILIGTCGAFFSPALRAVLPDITGKYRLVQANSVFGMLGSAANIVGNFGGGFLSQALGARLLFLFNRISCLFSAGSLPLARIPRVASDRAPLNFRADVMAGQAFVWRIRGLRLLLPFCQRSPGLGAARQGIAMAVFMGGMFIGMALTAIVKVPARTRDTWLAACGVVSMVCFIAFPFVRSFPLSLAAIRAGGPVNAVLNAFISAVMQGLTPVAFALAGALGEFLALAPLISGRFAAAMVFGLPMIFTRSFRVFIIFDPERDTIDSIS